MKKLPFLLLFFILCFSHGFAQPVASPDVKCVSVAANGDVTLTWVTPPNTGTFVEYKIFSSPVTPTAFTQVGTVNTYTTNTFTDIGAGANTQRVYYLVQTEYNSPSGISAPQDTFSTIYLNVTNFTIDIANLNWNILATPNISSSLKWYRVYRKYPAGAWMLRDSTQNLFYQDTLRVLCALSYVNYKIEISDSVGCISTSNIDSSQFKDQTSPVLEKIDTVSVDTSGNQNRATISWYQSPSPDAVSVVIYKAAWNAIDTVPVLPAFYTYTASNAGNVSESYRIAFLDSCDNLSPMGIEHQTIYLTATFDICATTATLKWNQYINMFPTSVNQYQIFRSVNGVLPFTLLATNSAGDTIYTDTGLALGTSYCYIVRATNVNGKTSSSNKACFNANVSQPPAYTYNRFATVLSDNSIQITAHVDTSGKSVKSYNILRATGTSGVFSDTFPQSKPIGAILTFTDNSANTGLNSYIYKVDAMDSCAHVIMTSNLGATMLLKAVIDPNLDITLTWSDYSDWLLSSVDHYEIYRAVDEVWETMPFTTVPVTGSGGTYTDDVSLFMSSKGIFSYKVVAIEGSGNTFGFKDSSASNIAKVYEYPKIYVPNCFTPNGDNMNDIFIPVIGFIDPGEYTFTIFDRTGTPVMRTNNPAEGWDGKKKSHSCPEGVYMYLVQCKASNGDASKISGTVSLIR